MIASVPWIVGFAACILASYFDVVARRIPNALTIALLACAPVAVGLAHGPMAGLTAVAIGLVTLALTFALYGLGLIGGGDAKFIAGLAALCGLPGAVDFLLLTAVCGGVLAIIVVFKRGELLNTFTRLRGNLTTALATGGLDAAVVAQSSARLPYALAVSGGFILTLLGAGAVPALRILH